MAMTSVRIPDDLMAQLQKTAEQRRRSKSWLINDAVREYLQREEIRTQRLAETRQSLAEVDKGQLIEGDEVLDWLDSWGTEDEKAPPK